MPVLNIITRLNIVRPLQGSSKLTATRRSSRPPLAVEQLECRAVPSASFGFAAGGGSSGEDMAFDIATDAAGNVFVTGTFQGTADFDPGPGVVNLTSAGSYGIFLGKYSADAELIWVRGMGGNGSQGQAGRALAVDSGGGVIVGGGFHGTGDFDPGPGVLNLSSQGTSEAFLARFDSAGNLVWAGAIGGNGGDGVEGLAADANGNSYATGQFASPSGGSADLDPGAGVSSVSSSGGTGGFIVKLDAAGGFVWGGPFAGTGPHTGGWDLDLDGQGNVYVTGGFSGTTDFDPGPGTFNLTGGNGGHNDGWIAKLDQSGNLKWARMLDGTPASQLSGIEVDAAGNVYTCGGFEGTVDADPGAGTFTLSSAGIRDILISKLDTDGNFLWARAMGGTGDDFAIFGVALDFAGSVYTTGRFEATVDFDPGAGVFNLTSAGASDVFVTKLDTDGNLDWTVNLGGTQRDEGYGLALDTAGNVYTTGFFNLFGPAGNTADFDPGPDVFNLTSTGTADVFVSVLVQDATAAIIGPTDGYQGVQSQPRTFTLVATGSAGADFSYDLDWGDATSETVIGPSGTQVTHVFQSAGAYTVTLTVTAIGGGSSMVVFLPLNILVVEQQGATLAVGGTAGNDAISIAATNLTGKAKVTINGVIQGIFAASLVHVYGGGNSDQVTIPGTSAAETFTIADASVAVKGVATTASDIESWIANGLAGNDTFTITGSGLPISLLGGANNDTFRINTSALLAIPVDGETGLDTLVGPNTVNTWSLTGINAGDLNGMPFRNIDNLTGGTNADSYLILPGGSLTSKIDGRTGLDKLDYSSFGGPVLVELQTKSATSIDVFANLENLVGSQSSDTLQAGDVANVWQITANDAGKIGTLNFASFENLTGGNAADTFKFSNGKSVAGVVDGGAGVNWLVYSLYTTAVVVDLAAQTTTGVGSGIFEIQNVVGGSGPDTLIGNSLGNVLIGGPGNDFLAAGASRSLLIGGQGMDTLAGGSQDDLLIGGYTTFDANTAALAAIMAEWQSANTYSVRIDHLRLGGGLNGANKLIAGTTVKDDLVTDSLTGGPAQDWFWATLSEIADLEPGEQVN